MRAIDLTQPMGIMSPPFPGGTPLIIRYPNRMSGEGYSQQELTFTTHSGTHLDGPLHFDSAGRDLMDLPIEKLCGEGAIADISDVGEYGIYNSKDVTDKVKVKEGDILILHTGFHKFYTYEKDRYNPNNDEIAYWYKFPGPHLEFRDWAMKMKLKWIGIDAPSLDHPMNNSYLRDNLLKQSLLRNNPESSCIIADFEKKHGKKREEIFPDKMDHMMHYTLFPKRFGELIHVENIGGDIEKVLNRRAYIGCFPLKIEHGESSPCRVVAFIEE